jgi:hypothetical protein
MVTIPEHCHASSTRLILVDHPLALEQLHPTATEGPLRPLHYWTDGEVHVRVFGLMELIPLLRLWRMVRTSISVWLLLSLLFNLGL